MMMMVIMVMMVTVVNAGSSYVVQHTVLVSLSNPMRQMILLFPFTQKMDTRNLK